MALVCFVFWLAADARLSRAVDLSVIVVGVLSLLPLVWLARKVLDRHPTPAFAVWTTIAALAVFFGLGTWFQSTLFVLWALLLVAPAALFFIVVYEEREMEIRFGDTYRRYRAATPPLWPSLRPGTPPSE